jgi:hypothetical protein
MLHMLPILLDFKILIFFLFLNFGGRAVCTVSLSELIYSYGSYRQFGRTPWKGVSSTVAEPTSTQYNLQLWII